MYLIYVDDSGNEEHGVLFSAVMLPAECWSSALGYWIALRRELANGPGGLPTFVEIHSQPFLSLRPLKPLRKSLERQAQVLAPSQPNDVLQSVALARAQIELTDLSLTASVRAAQAAGETMQNIAAAARLPQQDVEDRLADRDLSALRSLPCLHETSGGRTLRAQIFERCVDQIAALPGVHLMTAATSATSGDAKTTLYGELLGAVDEWLAGRDSWGTVVVDGTPSARTLYYRQAHRALTRATRRILEDEVIRDSSESHFIQMADIVAYCAHEFRLGRQARYLKLAERVLTPSCHPPSGADPGFFGS